MIDTTLTLTPKAVAAPLGFWFCFLVLLALRGHLGLGLALAGLFAVLYALILERRVEFEKDALILTPLLPLRTSQRLPWASLGTPHFGRGYAGVGTINVRLSEPVHYRFAGFIPRRSLDLTAIYRSASDGHVLHAAEIAALIQRSRLACAAEALLT